MKKILIYRGNGADPFSITSLVAALKMGGVDQHFALGWADRNLFQTSIWQKDTHLVILPGGRDIPYHNALKGPCNGHIKDFVQNGGNFLGICAGGYYGSAYLEFEPGGTLEVLDSRELKFFQGIARGPALGLNKFRYHSQEGAEIANLSLQGSFAAAYYNGGCAFIDAEKHLSVSIIARYRDLEEQLPAIISCKIERGLAVLSGVHPEYSAYFDCTKKYIKDPLFSSLKNVEEKRAQVFRTILQQFKW